MGRSVEERSQLNHVKFNSWYDVLREHRHSASPGSTPSMGTRTDQMLLKIAISFGALSPQLASLLARQRAEDPDTPILLLNAPLTELLQGLDDGRYDLGLALTTAGEQAASDWPLWHDELAAAVPARSPLLAYAAIPIQALAAYPMVRWCPYTCEPLSQQVDALIGGEAGTPLAGGTRVTSFEWMAMLVAAGYGVGIAPRSRIIQARAWGIVMRPLANGPYPTRTRLLHQGQKAVPAVERFAARAKLIAESQ